MSLQFTVNSYLSSRPVNKRLQVLSAGKNQISCFCQEVFDLQEQPGDSESSLVLLLCTWAGEQQEAVPGKHQTLLFLNKGEITNLGATRIVFQ